MYNEEYQKDIREVGIMAIYLCYDIHGHYDYFQEIKDKINLSNTDVMIVGGDAIDRGPNPIGLLKDILYTQNIHFLLGNHEHMMLQALKFHNNYAKEMWLRNGGEITLKQFERLPQKEQEDILNRLYHSLIAIPQLKVGDKNYYIAHASHAPRYISEPLAYSEATSEEIETILWSRDYGHYMPEEMNKQYKDLYERYPDTTLVIGHTPTYRTNYGVTDKHGLPRISRTAKGHIINMDCGCAGGFPLGCLRLNDGKEFYATLPDNLRIKRRK